MPCILSDIPYATKSAIPDRVIEIKNSTERLCVGLKRGVEGRAPWRSAQSLYLSTADRTRLCCRTLMKKYIPFLERKSQAAFNAGKQAQCRGSCQVW
jgi:hypothetical protein